MGKKIELAKKLYELAKRGVGGEKQNAANMLERFCKKNNISLDDIELEEEKDYYFKIKGEDQKKLIYQIAKRISTSLKCYFIPQDKVRIYHLPGNFIVTCSVSQYVEIKAMFDTYMPLYEQELDVFFVSFCMANDLLVKRTDNDEKASDDELKKQLRAYQISKQIQSKTHRKQIEK